MRYLVVSSLCAALWVTSGCASRQDSASPAKPAAPSALDQRDFNELDVKAVASVSQRRGDLLVVQTELKNDSQYDRTVFWRYRWFDGAGMQIGVETTWNPLLVYGRQTQYIKGVAPSPKATTFKLELTAQDTQGPK